MVKAPVAAMTFADLPGSGLLEALTPDEVARSVHFVTPEGTEYHGGEAVPAGRAPDAPRAHRRPHQPPPPLWLLHELAYGVVASIRGPLGFFARG